MPENLSYNELYEKYLDLQLRVTRHSSLQQELINTRDQMDQELEIYKRMNYFHSEGLKVEHVNDLVDLAAEAILDIFETEIGYCFYQNLKDPQDTYKRIEGVSRRKSDEINLTLERIRNKCECKGLSVFDQGNLPSEWEAEALSCLIISRKVVENHDYEITIIAAITKEKESTFRKYDKKLETLFSVFLEPVQAFVSNIISSNQIKEQLHQIKKADLEMKKLSMIATKTNSGVIISNSHGEIEWVNQSFTNTTGYTLEEVIGRKPKDFLQPGADNNQDKMAYFSKQLGQKKGIQLTLLNKRKNGEIFYNRLEITPIFNEENQLINFIAIQQDITAEQQYKLDLQRINKRFEIVTENTEIGIWEFDLKSRTAQWNSVMLNCFDLAEEDDADLYELWRNSIHQEDRTRLLQIVDQQARMGYPKSYTAEYRINLPVKGLRYFMSTSVVEGDDDHRKLLGTSIDITKSKQDELMILEQNKELTKTNQELDQFVYSISHDLRSPLLSIKGILNLINEGVWQDNYHQYLDLISQSVDRLDNTILEILDYSRNARVEQTKSTFDVKDKINEIFQDLSHISKGIKTELIVEGESKIFSDELRLNIVLKNLISNALKYHNIAQKSPFVRASVTHKDGLCVISIEDNGEGISENNQKQVFDMFYRASTTSAGTGLGLYICKEVMNKLNGEISLQSEQGVGTIVEIKFPVNEK